MKVEIVLSTVLAVSTVIYTGINLMLWFESRATRKQRITPYVIAFLQTTDGHNVLALHIKNIGEGLAKNVRIKVIKDHYQLRQKDLPISNVGIIKNGFNNLPPHYELSYYLDLIEELNPVDEIGSIELEISCEDTEKRKYLNSFVLPFNQVIGQNYSNPPESFIGQIPYYLKEINKTLKAKKE